MADSWRRALEMRYQTVDKQLIIVELACIVRLESLKGPYD